MIILIPLGGSGKRFKNNNYKKPKALINIFGQPVIDYLLENLKINNNCLIYIPYNKEYTQYRFEDYLIKKYPNYNFKFFKLEQDTRGAAETINIALNNLVLKDQPILCLDADNFYDIDIIKLWNNKNKVFCFSDKSNNPIYSYIKCESEYITEIIEKEKISDLACCGAYGFESYKELLNYTNVIISNNIKQKDEFYTSGVIKYMINEKINFEPEIISKSNWHCLGTPLQVKYFYNNYPKIKCITNHNNIKQKRICFDLDNTLVTYPKVKDDYTTVEPIQKNIDFLKYLKKIGNVIIIYTARRMKTHNGCIGKIMSDIGKITFDTLDNFDIPYDEIYFGKPYADFYIDDLALNCFDDLEKELGFYLDEIKPRDFNSIEKETIELYTKKSNDLSGEIYYYNNIPRELKDLFPIFFDYDINNKWYKIEKIEGLTVSTIYLSGLMTKNLLINIMNSIKRIQDTEINIKHNKNINIYLNYSEKIKKRYENYDYSIFKNSDITYSKIINFFDDYERNNKGKITVIHGDTVMTNILINNYEKIKFIDMRGKCGDILTIYGDWLYDWAKLYQSLVGYDKILLEKNIDINYEKNMIGIFEKYFLELYSEQDFCNLKNITNSLLFSLIPLHNNKKCIQFYELINFDNL